MRVCDDCIDHSRRGARPGLGLLSFIWICHETFLHSSITRLQCESLSLSTQMGTCISTRSNIRVSHMASSVKDEPQKKVKPIEVLMEQANHLPCNKLLDESSVRPEKSVEKLEHESKNHLSSKYESFIDNLNDNEIDSIVRMRLEEYISDSSDSDSSIQEDGNMLWIPFSMAQHMGVTRVTRSLDTIGDCLDTRDRIYANDEDLFMSVETSRRSSHLTSLSLPLSTKAVKSRPAHSFVTQLTQTKIEENINNNICPTDDSSELIDAEIQNYDDSWISIKINR